jgi:two-component system sensor histidine kinase ChvG
MSPESETAAPRLRVPASPRPILRFFSRISIRLMAFNLLLLFLPFAGILYLDVYEERLEAAQERAMAAEARVLAAAMGDRGKLEPEEAQRMLLLVATSPANNPHPRSRLRILDAEGRVLADTYQPLSAEMVIRNRSERIRQNWLYRLGAFLVRPIARIFLPSQETLQPAELYERPDRLLGPEVQAALDGRYGADKRASETFRTITLYAAVPIANDGRVVGVAHGSQSTVAILQDLYPVRLGLFRIFMISLVMAIVLSLLVAMTIVRPLRRLRHDAGTILDRRGRIKDVFKGSGKLDEIGDLSRALERLTRRLDSHVRFIESFASDVSHEFKNPLASIRTASEMLAEVEEPLERRRFRKMVDQEIARMENLLSGVRDITFIDAQLAREVVQPIALDQLLSQIVDGFRLRFGSNLTLELEIGEGRMVVEGSAERLTQVFENILDNAVSFSGGQPIQIRVENRQGSVLTTVADRGPGIPEGHLEKIFDRFFTYREGMDRRKSGHTGLGLAIVKAIVEGYGGTVRAGNRPDGGAVFEVRMPAGMRA